MERTIEIGGEAYPIRYDFTALRKVAKLAGKTTLTDLAQIGEGIELDHVPQLARIGLERAMERAKDKRKVPTLDEIEAELDERMALMTEVLETFGADISGSKEAEPSLAEGN